MVTRETSIHLVAILLALLGGILASNLHSTAGVDGPVIVLVSLLSYGIVFGGAHLYLAWRGEGGMVPPTSRWRFLTALVSWLVLAAIGALGPDGTFAGQTVDSLLVGLGIVVLVGYWVLEARAGYRSSRPS